MLPHLHLTLDDIDRVQCNLIVSNLRAIVVFVLLEGFFDEALEMQLDDVQLSVHLPFIRKRCRVVHLDVQVSVLQFDFPLDLLYHVIPVLERAIDEPMSADHSASAVFVQIHFVLVFVDFLVLYLVHLYLELSVYFRLLLVQLLNVQLLFITINNYSGPHVSESESFEELGVGLSIYRRSIELEIVFWTDELCLQLYVFKIDLPQGLIEPVAVLHLQHEPWLEVVVAAITHVLLLPLVSLQEF